MPGLPQKTSALYQCKVLLSSRSFAAILPGIEILFPLCPQLQLVSTSSIRLFLCMREGPRGIHGVSHLSPAYQSLSAC